MTFSLYRCELVPEDFLFFVSREFNTYTQVQPHIHNYALSYAIARRFTVGSLGTTPNYSELTDFDLYATPALPTSTPSYVTHTYNSICSRTNITQSGYNVPALGRISKISPVSTPFEFLVFATSERKPPKYIRVGKKSCICRVSHQEMEIEDVISQPEEVVTVDYCFNLLDLSVNDIVESADMIMTYPSPIARTMTVKAPHIVVRINDETTALPIPRHLRTLEDL